MKILHTSDWHLGRSLYHYKRYEEFEMFLNWLSKTIESEKIDILLVAGDIFDTGMPSNQAQKLYYSFLCRIANSSCCNHVVITAGNHDSPTFLTAPEHILNALNVHVIGVLPDSIKDEVLLLDNKDQTEQIIVCAVPYLRERDIRTSEAGENIDDKNKKVVEGIKNHYAEVCRIAEEKRVKLKLKKSTPIVAMGHLFAVGGKTVDNDGVREMYVGTLAHISKDVFPKNIDYMALGHLHVPQKVKDCDYMRYCGSPLPIGFGEAKQDKKVCLIEFSEGKRVVNEISVPVFRKLEQLSGNLEEILSRLKTLKLEEANTLLEIEYCGDEIAGNLRTSLDDAVVDTKMEILRIKNQRIVEKILNNDVVEDSLDDLTENEIFERCLDVYEVPNSQRGSLIATYKEILMVVHEDDKNAE